MVKTKKAIDEFKRELRKLYGGRLKSLILYGSYARGEATVDSDIDLLVVLEGEVYPGEEIDRMIDIITEINLKYNVLISVYPVSEENYEKLNSPLLMNVRKEGVWV
ncbi:MAG TPA: nucleotidyltransferase domain-containing protein [candidate division Zixibacteria bacterium]|nr:nucleotidyltransferase domain-containing protein [candidate division Zixibacteria bacterium]